MHFAKTGIFGLMNMFVLAGFLVFIHPQAGAEPFQVFEENGKVGLRSPSGDVLIPPMYEALGWSDGTFSVIDQVTGYQLNNQWGLITITNQRITGPEFFRLVRTESQLLLASRQHTVTQRISTGCIDTRGKIVIPFSYAGIKIHGLRAITYSVDADNRLTYGLVDLEHRTIIPAAYQSIYPLGGLRYAVQNLENKTALFTDNGKPITGFSIDSLSPVQNDLMIIYQNGKQGLMNRNGEILRDPLYREIEFKTSHWYGRMANEWHYLSSGNEPIKKIECDSIAVLAPDRLAITSASGVQLANFRLDPVGSDRFTSIQPFYNGYAVFSQHGKQGVLKKDGTIVLPAVFNRIRMHNGYLLIQKQISFSQKWFLCDTLGRELTPKGYDFIGPFTGRFFPVVYNGFHGALNANGHEQLACVYDSLLEVKDGLVAVKFKGLYGIISENEAWLVTPQPFPVKLINRERYLVYAGSLVTLKSIDGNTIYFTTNPLEWKDNFLTEHLRDGGKWAISLNGQISMREQPPVEQAETVWPASEGLRMIKRNGRYGFIDDQGRLRIANRYEEVRPFREGMAAIKIRNKWGFINQEDKIIVQPVYDEVSDIYKGQATVKQNGKYGLINREGLVLLPVRYDELVTLPSNRIRLRTNEGYGLATEHGDLALHPKYEYLEDLNNGYVLVRQHGKYGLVTVQGITTIPIIYDFLFHVAPSGNYFGLLRKEWQRIR